MKPSSLTRQLRAIGNEADRIELHCGEAIAQAWEDWRDLEDVAYSALDISEEEKGAAEWVIVALKDGIETGRTKGWSYGLDKSVDRLTRAEDADYTDIKQPEVAVVKFMGRLMTGYETMARMVTASNETLRQELHSLRAHERTIEERRMAALEAEEDAKTQRHERELAAERAKRRLILEADIMGDVKALLPVVVNKFAGKALLAESDKQTLKAFYESLSEEESMRIMGALAPAKQAALMAMFKDVGESGDEEPKDDKKKKKKKVTNGTEPEPN